MNLIKYLLSSQFRKEVSDKVVHDHAIINEQYEKIYTHTILECIETAA